MKRPKIVRIYSERKGDRIYGPYVEYEVEDKPATKTVKASEDVSYSFYDEHYKQFHKKIKKSFKK